MQNIMRPHPSAPSPPAFVPRRAIAALAVLLFACAMVGVPASASAKSYTSPQVNITAEAQSDGALHVVEQRTFDFDGSFTAVWWTFEGLPDDASIQVNGVSIADLGSGGDAQDVELVSIPETAFNLEWREAGGPGTTAYSVDEGKNTTYVFFDATDTQLLVQFDYTVVNAVQAYADCAELYWKYVSEGWSVDSDNVTCTISLPVPSGTSPAAGTDVRAWGHGPLTGSLAFNDDASVVTYQVDKVPSGEYSEARIVFPVEWLTNASDEMLAAHSGIAHLDTVLQEEQKWADRANAQRRNALIFLIALGALTLALIAWALVMYFRHGREHKPTFVEDYWRDAPAEGVHPAAISRLVRWNRQAPQDFTATIMHLANEGYLVINRGTYTREDKKGKPQVVEDYYLTRGTRELAGADIIDKKAIGFLFDVVGQHQDSFWLGSVAAYGKEHPESFNDNMENWQRAVGNAVDNQEYFEAKGTLLQGNMVAIGIGYAVLMIVASWFTENFWPVLFGIIGGVALYAISNFMPRRSQKGVDDYARAMALKRWLKDFTALKERPPADAKVWGEFMVYAYIFGVAEQVVRQLRDAVPEMFAQEDAWAQANTSYVPWYGLYVNDPITRSNTPSFSDAFNTSWSNTMSTATAAISAAKAASSGGGWSSGGGFGGGFSGGGGGGFGGGGGAR